MSHSPLVAFATLASVAMAAIPSASAQNLATGGDPLTALSTRFDKPDALSGWQVHEVEGWASKWAPPRIEGGVLVLQPHSSGWIRENHAGHLYRVVGGDFIVTTRIKVKGTRAALPQTIFSLAGLFVRAPRELATAAEWAPGRENWLFFSTGTAMPAGKPHYEIKTTVNSNSVLKVVDSREGWVELRIARTGEVFTLLHKPDGAKEFAVADIMIRPDLPNYLNVGLTAYSDSGSVAAATNYNKDGAPQQNADMVAEVERIDFRRPKSRVRLSFANLDAPTGGPLDAALEARKQDFLRD